MSVLANRRTIVPGVGVSLIVSLPVDPTGIVKGIYIIRCRNTVTRMLKAAFICMAHHMLLLLYPLFCLTVHYGCAGKHL